MIQKHESKMNCEGECCMWEINNTNCLKQKARLIAIKTNVDELAGGNNIFGN